jgi:hypothetical protein
MQSVEYSIVGGGKEISGEPAFMGNTFIHRSDEGCCRAHESAYGQNTELFIHHITNARTAWINSKIALIEKMVLGYGNKERLKTAIYFRCGNLYLYP